MSAQARADILLKVGSDMAELRRLQEEMLRTRQNVELNAGKMGAAFAVANQGISGALAGIKAAMKGTLTDGVKFNAQLEQAQVGVASVLRQFNPERYKDFRSAMTASTGVLEQLRKKAKETSATFGELLEGFQSSSGAMAGAGIPLEKQVNLISMMSQTLTALGIQQHQLRQETTAILTGNINRNAQAAMMLGITAQDVARAKEAGQLYEFLTSKMSSFAKASELAAGNISVLEGNLKDAVTNQAADATKELTESYRELLKALTDLVNAPGTKSFLESLAGAAAKGVNLATWAANTARENPAAVDMGIGVGAAVSALIGGGWVVKLIKAVVAGASVSTIAPLVAIVAAAGAGAGWVRGSAQRLDDVLNANNVARETHLRDARSLITGARTPEELSVIRAEIATWLAEAQKRAAPLDFRATARADIGGRALGADGKPVADANGYWIRAGLSQEEKGERAFLGASIKTYQNLLTMADERGDKIIEENRLLDEQARKLAAIEKINKDGDTLRKQLVDDLKKNTEAESKALFEAITEPEAKLEALQKKLLEERMKLTLTLNALGRPDPNNPGQYLPPTDEDNQAADSARAAFTAKEATLKKQILETEKKITEEREKQNKKDATEHEKALRDRLNTQESALQGALTKIVVEKGRIERNELLTTNERRAANVEQLKKELAAYEAFKRVLNSEWVMALTDQEKQTIKQRIDAIHREIEKASGSIAGGEQTPLRGLEKFSAQLRQMDENFDPMFDVVNAGFNSMSSGINDALTNAKSFGEGFKTILSSLGQGISQAIMQIISMKMAMMAFQAVGLGSWIPGGGGKFSGGYMLPGYASGGLPIPINGYTPPGEKYKPAGVVHAGEWVAPQWMVKSPRVGPMISALEQMRVTRKGFAGGGAVDTTLRMVNEANAAAQARGTGGEAGPTFNYTFEAGVTRQELAALIPVLERKTIAAMEEKQRRRK